jgi:hypothetical protein
MYCDHTVIRERSRLAVPGQPVSPDANGTFRDFLERTEKTASALSPPKVGDCGQLGKELIGVYVDRVSHYIIIVAFQGSDRSILIRS